MLISFFGLNKNFKNIWFSSDLHLGHAGIIELCNRPFKSVEEMDSVLINNINDNVKKDDLYIFLGDFCYWKSNHVELFNSYMSKINCKNIIFVYGNHDHKIRESVSLNSKTLLCGDLLDISIDNHKITLCHYPMRTWNKCHSGSWHLFGHVHNQFGYDKKNCFNLSVENTNYSPIPFNELFSLIK